MVDGWLTLDEAADTYGVKRDRLKRAATEGRLASRKLGRRANSAYIVQPAEVERFLRESRPGPKPRRKGGAAASGE